ncbi:MAG TPA: gamma-glutamyltransferase, partial [Spirochaetia bacterium]|nr:gamma-glutamyltransferase [Spirochaetia bacterium]
MKFASSLEYLSRKSPVASSGALVASSQVPATQVGVEILNRGGNAADAAIAVAAALQVTQPCSTGIGGDCFVLYYEAATKR